jgi:hypothetical protein
MPESSHPARCGRAARGHDPHPTQVLTVDRITGDAARPVDELHVEIGTRFVVVCDGVPSVLYAHDPERLTREWDRCRAEGGVVTFNRHSSLLRFPDRGSVALLSVSEAAVRCELADVADVEALARLAAALEPAFGGPSAAAPADPASYDRRGGDAA